MISNEILVEKFGKQDGEGGEGVKRGTFLADSWNESIMHVTSSNGIHETLANDRLL